MNNSRPQISLCMLVQNSAKTMRLALDSVKEFVDEFIFVDGGSTDDTVEIARSYRNSKVLSHAWDGNHARQRNLALDVATGPWILMLDSDECLGAHFGSFLNTHVMRSNRDAFSFPRFWLVGTEPLRYVRSQTLYPDPQVRLWRHGAAIRYSSAKSNTIHEILMLQSNKIGFARGVHIFHFDFLLNSKDARLAKVARYDAASELAGSPNRAGTMTRNYYIYEDYPHTIAECEEPLAAGMSLR